MDAFGAAVQAASVLILVINLIRKAVERQKDLAEVLGKYGEEVNETKCIVELVQDQDVLESGAIIASLRRVESIGVSLRDHMLGMAKERGKVKAFAHQVTQGNAERQDLATNMELLVRARQSLTMHIQLVHVGLTRDAKKAIAVNTILVERIDRVVQCTLGHDRGLQIASFVQAKLRSRRPEADGTLRLTPAEYESLVSEGIKLAHPETDAANGATGKQRIICDNFSDDTSFQLNVPVENDMWAEMNLVKVEGNVAQGNSIQGNYPMSMQVFDKLLQARTATGAKSSASKRSHY